jgi:glycolate oxidase FAD binding subunit
VAVFEPASDALMKLQAAVKASFDPAGILNPGRMAPLL